MSWLEEIAKDPNYDAEASAATKASIFTFIATFIACLFLFDNTVNLLTGALFVFVGMFAVSIIVAAPFLLLKKKVPKASILFSLLEFLVTVFVTVMVFSYFFTNPMDFATAAAPSDDNPYTLKCEEPIPEFTLSGRTVPNKTQVDTICACIWKEMPLWAKEISVSASEGRESEVSEMQLRAFISRFGQKVRECNIENL